MMSQSLQLIVKFVMALQQNTNFLLDIVSKLYIPRLDARQEFRLH